MDSFDQSIFNARYIYTKTDDDMICLTIWNKILDIGSGWKTEGKCYFRTSKQT